MKISDILLPIYNTSSPPPNVIKDKIFFYHMKLPQLRCDHK